MNNYFFIHQQSLIKRVLEASKSVSIQVPEHLDTVSYCTQHGWFAGEMSYARLHLDGIELDPYCPDGGIVHWGARCPHGCFVTGGRDQGCQNFEMLKELKKPTVCTKPSVFGCMDIHYSLI